jgi:hypothetical protein
MKKLYALLAKLLGLFLVLLTTLFAGKKLGKAEVEKKQAEKSLKQAKKANEIDDEVRALSDADLNSRLRKHERK